MINIFGAIFYLFTMAFAFLGDAMKSVLRRLFVVFRFSTLTDLTTIALNPSATALSILRTLFSVCRRVLLRAALLLQEPKGSSETEMKPSGRSIERKLDALSEQLSLFDSRMEYLERTVAVKDAAAAQASFKFPAAAPRHQPSLSSRDARRAAAFATRRCSLPSGVSSNYATLLQKASYEESIYSDGATPSPSADSSPLSDSNVDSDASTTASASVPSTPMTSFSTPATTSRRMKRMSTGLKPLLLPAMLSLDGTPSSIRMMTYGKSEDIELENEPKSSELVGSAMNKYCSSPEQIYEEDRSLKTFGRCLGLGVDILPTIHSKRVLEEEDGLFD